MNKTWRVLKIDIPNSNKRIYPRSVVEKTIDWFKKLPPRSLYGQLGMSNDSIIHFSEVSHVVKDLKIDGDYLVAEIEVLTTPNGKLLEKMINESSVAFRTAGVGGYSEPDEKGNIVIEESFKLITVNALPLNEAAKF